MPPAKNQRDFARQIVDQLRSAGHIAYWAGGCVRDELLGTRPKDYDVATDATPDAVRALFGRNKTIAVGAAFGVITVLGARRIDGVEVATFRRDAAYSDGRHPDAVAFSSPEEDAKRRDFTINGLFFDPAAERVIDFVDGQEDLRAKRIRAIGDPAERIAEDKLRMLRAIRFAAALDFTIDAATLAAVQSHAHEITSVSAERIGAEVRRMLIDRHRARGLALLAESNLLAHVLPELQRLLAEESDKETAASAWGATLDVVHALDAPSLPLALAAALHRVAEKGIAGVVGRRLRFSNKEIERTDWLLTRLPKIANAPTVPWPRVQRILVHDGATELIALRAAIAGDADPAVVFCRSKLALDESVLNPPAFITGDDLVALGFEPGKQFASILRAVRDAQLEGQIATRPEAEEFVRRRFGAGEV